MYLRQIKSGSFLIFFLIHELISGIQSCRSVICYSCSLHFKVSLFESLVSEQMYPEFQACTSPLSFHSIPEKSGSEATQNTIYADPRPVGHGNPHTCGSETNGCVKQKYSYIYVITSVIQLIQLGHFITFFTCFNSL